MPLTDFLSNAENVAKLNQFVSIKQPPTIITQTPAPGTPVVAGMTIEVQAISFSDVPLQVFVPDAPVAVRNVPVADLQNLVVTDDSVKSAVTSGTVTDADRAAVTEKLNTGLAGRGLTGTIAENDTVSVVKAIGGMGLFGH